MKLRSHGAGSSSSKGKAKPKYQQSSDEYGGVLISSDSDYSASSDEEIAPEISDDRLLHNECNNRKRNSWKNKKEYSCKRQKIVVDDGGMELNGNIETEAGNCPVEYDSTGALENKNGRKKRSKKKKDRPVLMWEVLEQENNRWTTENLAKDMDLTNQNEMATEIVEPPDDLIIPLLRYQKEWLA